MQGVHTPGGIHMGGPKLDKTATYDGPKIRQNGKVDVDMLLAGCLQVVDFIGVGRGRHTPYSLMLCN